jgi:phosphomannomutase
MLTSCGFKWRKRIFMKTLKFGTDGWRGVIADDFTMENVALVSQAVMSYIKRQGGPKNVVLGFDTRFMSQEAARLAASVAAGNGIGSVMSGSCVTTPMLTHATIINRAFGGLMVTASHNPYKYNGIKYKTGTGGSASSGTTAEIESLIGAEHVSSPGYEEACLSGMVKESDFFEAYSEDLYSVLDKGAFRGGAPEAVFDCMHGAAGAYAARIWEGLGMRVRAVRTGKDPYFGGSSPEPVAENLYPLKTELSEGGYDVGFASDGDGDRIAVMSPSGTIVDSHVVICLLAIHLSRNRGMTGSVVRSVSTSSLVDRVAADLGLPVVETPVGFKHICERMRTGDVLIGGEENGGMGIKGYMPERDAFLSALLVLEMLATRAEGLDKLVAELDERYGRLYYKRYDLSMEGTSADKRFGDVCEGLPKLYSDLGSMEIRTTDGFKAVFSDGSWVLFRLSGTEPLVRVYAESEDPGRLELMLSRAKEALGG